MAETGILHGLQKRYENLDIRSQQTADLTTARDLDLSAVAAAFVVFGVGITASMIALVIEICCRDSLSLHLVLILLNKLRSVKH